MQRFLNFGLLLTLMTTFVGCSGGGSSDSAPAPILAALAPTFASPSSTDDGFIVQVSNHDSDYTWAVNTSAGSVSISGSGLIIVTELTPGLSATVTVTTSRTGYARGTANVSGTATTGAALTPSFASPSSTADGFTAQVNNHNSDYGWAVSTSAGSVNISGSGLVTVTGLSPGLSATVTVTTSRTGYAGGTANLIGTAAAGCGAAAQIDFVEAVIDEWYLWYGDMADVEKSDYDSAQAYLDARLAPLIESRRDLFSRMTTITEDETSISSGAYIGFGFRSVSDATRLRIIDVFESGPAYAAGIRRGMELIAVDTGSGFETIEELSARGATNEEVFGASEIGVSRTFRFLSQGEELDFEVAKEELSPPALAGEPLLIEREGLTPVGYLNLRQFIDAALDPAEGYFSLADASQLFAGEGVTDLIVDLRYNGGGLLRVADTMMDLLAGVTAEGEPSYKIQVNDQHPGYNEDQVNWGIFDRMPETASPIRIAFITSGNTASASELVINGLAPHVETVLIGADTYGKQVGQGRWDMHEGIADLERADCDVALRLTAFEIVNGENQGEYHQVGLEGTGRFTLCAAEDDITRAFGDPRETLVATALDWFGSGACPSVASRSAPQTKAQLRSKSTPWLPAEFIPERVDENLR